MENPLVESDSNSESSGEESISQKNPTIAGKIPNLPQDLPEPHPERIAYDNELSNWKKPVLLCVGDGRFIANAFANASWVSDQKNHYCCLSSPGCGVLHLFTLQQRVAFVDEKEEQLEEKSADTNAASSDSQQQQKQKELDVMFGDIVCVEQLSSIDGARHFVVSDSSLFLILADDPSGQLGKFRVIDPTHAKVNANGNYLTLNKGFILESIEHPEHYVTANDDGYLLLSDSDPALVLFPSLPGVSIQRMEKVPVKKGIVSEWLGFISSGLKAGGSFIFSSLGGGQKLNKFLFFMK
eukprot:TRINITY_DN15056_c0_g1_i1.p1 TRINITY_DN15056_c0_g1~~TRINITY_DN15056_c0_g1_i1.p1  ORF type:complete len:296 (+),score=80.42 TRINITY_DN15056_c0_g1_i1:30-917(+)